MVTQGDTFQVTDTYPFPWENDGKWSFIIVQKCRMAWDMWVFQEGYLQEEQQFFLLFHLLGLFFLGGLDWHQRYP